MELSVIVPCWNEADNVGELVARVGRVLDGAWPGDRGELILVDDGSTDGTWAAIEQASASRTFVVGARHDRNRGLEAAWRTGLARSRGRLVCLLDADLQYRPEEIPRLHAALVEGAAPVDLVQGWRSPVGRARDSRWLISRALNVILNALFAMDLPDNKSGFLLCRREVLSDLLSHRGRYRYFQILVMVAAKARGHTYRLVETPFDPRRAGRSFFGALPIGTSLRALADIARALVEYRIGS